MIEFIQENLTTILSGTAVGAAIGGVVGLVANGSGSKAILTQAVGSEARTLLEALNHFQDGVITSKSGFESILGMISPEISGNDDEDDTPQDILPDGIEPPSESIDTTEPQSESSLPALDKNLAGKLLAAVLAIPALPKLPDLTSNFETLRDNELFSATLSTLSNLDTDGLNSMMDEFKTLMQTTIQPGLDKAAEEGFDFILEPETIDTLTRSASEFIKTIGGMNDSIGGVVSTLTRLIDDFTG